MTQHSKDEPIPAAGSSAGGGQVDETHRRAALAQMTRLIATVCHDLRSPLSSIVMGGGFLQKSLGKLDGMGPEKRILESVMRSTTRLNALVSDLHDLAHIETGHFEIEKHPLDVASLVTTAVETLQESGAKRNVKLEAGPVKPDVHVTCDRTRILQAIGELVENAVRYAPMDGTVRLDVAVKPDRVEFTVADEGVGMTDVQVEHAFDAFWHAAQSPRDGTGLGLPLVRGIAIAHGGDAKVTSAPQKGTRVTFWVPSAP